MNTSKQIAKHLHEVYFGGNWTTTNLKEVLSDVSWQEATYKFQSLNTIVTLAYHVNYFVKSVSEVLEGKPLTSKDALSFNYPAINSQEDWSVFVSQILDDGKRFSILIENLPEEMLNQSFVDEKYGIYYRNLHGIIEHIHYHLGQMVIIKKLIRNNA